MKKLSVVTDRRGLIACRVCGCTEVWPARRVAPGWKRTAAARRSVRSMRSPWKAQAYRASYIKLIV